VPPSATITIPGGAAHQVLIEGLLVADNPDQNPCIIFARLLIDGAPDSLVVSTDLVPWNNVDGKSNVPLHALASFSPGPHTVQMQASGVIQQATQFPCGNAEAVRLTMVDLG